MANFEIPSSPEYTEQIRKFETTDPAHAKLFNTVIEALLNNDAFLKLAVDAAFRQATGYTDTKIGQLINGAPSTLDTLGEIAQAMQANDNVVDALNQAIGSKASEADFAGHAGNNTVHITASERQGWNGHVSNTTVHITESERQAWNGKADANHTHGYLPLSGGTLSGGIIFSADRGPGLSWFNTRQCLFTAQRNNVGTGCFLFYPQGATSDQGLLAIGDYAANDFKVWPIYDNQYDIGTSNRRFKQIYAANAAISTSDERLKDNIHTLDNTLTKAFIMGLNPISYTMTDGDSGRRHYGFGAQSVEKLMDEIGISSMDFAGFIKSPVEVPVEVEEEIDDENGQKIRQKKIVYQTIEGEYRYGLRYEEFIAPLTKVVQIQEETICKQGKMIQELSSKLEILERYIDTVKNPCV